MSLQKILLRYKPKPENLLRALEEIQKENKYIGKKECEKIAEYFFPASWSRVLESIRPYGPLILMAVVFLGVLNYIIIPPLRLLMGLLVG